jgi:putative transposase
MQNRFITVIASGGRYQLRGALVFSISVEPARHRRVVGYCRLAGSFGVDAAIMSAVKSTTQQNTPVTDKPLSYAGYRFPPDVISYSVWLYYRFPLSLRMVEELLAARGIELTHETVRRWALKFGLGIARHIRSTALARGDKGHLDEVVITIIGKKHWLWRAVDQHGAVLDVLVQSRRDRHAARRLMRKLLTKHGRAPRVLIIDKLKSYAAANRDLGLD